jgi:YD repeat-containing protein
MTAGNVTSRTDPEGNITEYLYDSQNNLTKETSPNPGLDPVGI